MTDVSILIPYAYPHRHLVKYAVASAIRQTVPCAIYTMLDTERRGPGWVRNRLLAKVDTKYTLFLDADDWLEPTCVEDCLNAIQPGHYVYVDWFAEDKHRPATEKAWCGPDTWHVITALIETAHIRAVGGFDQTLPALEDTDFWLKMVTNRFCGIRVPKPLMHYSDRGVRSQPIHKSGRDRDLKDLIIRRYGGKMGCCGEENIIDNSIPVGEPQPGDVEAMALWHGNHIEHGRATGRTYPRMSWPRITWVDPHDIQKSPNLWKAIEKPIEPAHNGNGHTPEPDMKYEGVEGLADALMDAGILEVPIEAYPKPELPLIADEPGNGADGIVAAPLNEPGRLSPAIPLFTPELHDIVPDYRKLVALGKALYAD
jgi:hypothetical protein